MNALLIACFFMLSVTPVIADDDDKPVAKLSGSAGQGTIFLAAKAQAVSGLQTITLSPVSDHPEFTAYGKAVNIQPLVELRHRYLVALTERSGATARFQQAEQNIKRQQDLYREGATSKHNLQVQHAQWQTDKAQVDASGVQGKTIIAEARINWGKKLAELALSADSDPLSGFLSGQKTLLHITLPVNKQLANEIQTIYVEASGNRSAAIKAELISAAPQTDNTVQGESYFFQTDGSRIRTGMRVAAWIPEQNENRSGVIIPKSALVWYMDQAFVYIKTDAEQFSRRAIDQYSATADGYFVGNGISAGEQLVVTGGQMLLSEELRGQIPDEGD
ncbi:efflux RND transporter periplasmic adaptor subunit [Methylobacter sp.]|uniref:efflux RND transporter periplasmic adaptor subunit n=1 Tax=Methylobacter sp. TaxID=2051955 RepID=UPI002FDCBA97